MSFITLKRVVQAGYMSFRRNGWVSTATVLVMALVLFVLGNLIFLSALSNTVLSSFESKIDISVYFKPDSEEAAVLQVKKDLEAVPDVSEVSYVSKQQALDTFRERHKANATIISALDELGENPLAASLNIKAKDSSNYGAISNFLLDKNYPSVEKVNYFENQVVIDRLGAILGTTRKLGALLMFILGFIAVLVAFNTIRMAIYTMREEIGIMRLVGATSWFIRGPFLTTGILYGSVAALLTTIVFFPLVWLLAPRISLIVPNFDLYHYFLAHFFEFFGIMFGTGIGIGVVSSSIAVRRYLKI